MGFLFLKGIYHYIKKETFKDDYKILKSSSFCSVPLKCFDIIESEPVVSVGDDVKVGTLIAKPASKFGLNIYSPITGRVLNIYNKLSAAGENVKHVLISPNVYESVDSESCEDLNGIDSTNEVELLNRLKEAGIVDGLSKMPSYLKYAYSGPRSYNQLLIIMDSTDPNFSVYETLAKYHKEEVINGAKYFMSITNAKEITFVFNEGNTSLAYEFSKHIKENKKNYDYKIRFVLNKYPFDNPYLIAQALYGNKFKKNNNFLSAGIAMETAESCYNFCRAVEFNKPVTQKIVSVDGNNILRKGNYLVPIGMSYSEILAESGIVNDNVEVRLITGNLMSGHCECSDEMSVDMLTNSIVEMQFDPFEEKKELPCISCGKCAKVCPMSLKPMILDQAYIDNDFDKLRKWNVNSCIDCGCCSYICPSRRCLAQRISAAKAYDKKRQGEK